MTPAGTEGCGCGVTLQWDVCHHQPMTSSPLSLPGRHQNSSFFFNREEHYCTRIGSYRTIRQCQCFLLVDCITLLFLFLHEIKERIGHKWLQISKFMLYEKPANHIYVPFTTVFKILEVHLIRCCWRLWKHDLHVYHYTRVRCGATGNTSIIVPETPRVGGTKKAYSKVCVQEEPWYLTRVSGTFDKR